MSRLVYLTIWAIVNLIAIVSFTNGFDIAAWKVCLIFFVGNLSGMLCEYIGNDLRILNRDKGE